MPSARESNQDEQDENRSAGKRGSIRGHHRWFAAHGLAKHVEELRAAAMTAGNHSTGSWKGCAAPPWSCGMSIDQRTAPLVPGQSQNPQAEARATENQDAAPRPDCSGTRFAHWPPAGRCSQSEKPSQGRRSLSRFPASGPQGFWPVELNLKWGSRQNGKPSPSFRFQDLRLLACGRGTILFSVIAAV